PSAGRPSAVRSLAISVRTRRTGPIKPSRDLSLSTAGAEAGAVPALAVRFDWAVAAALETIRPSVIKQILFSSIDIVFSNSLRQAKFGKMGREVGRSRLAGTHRPQAILTELNDVVQRDFAGPDYKISQHLLDE